MWCEDLLQTAWQDRGGISRRVGTSQAGVVLSHIGATAAGLVEGVSRVGRGGEYVRGAASRGDRYTRTPGGAVGCVVLNYGGLLNGYGELIVLVDASVAGQLFEERNGRRENDSDFSPDER